MMKTLEVVIKMALFVLKKCEFPQISTKWQQKFIFLELILKLHLTEQEKALKNLNQINFVTSAVSKKPKILSFFISLARQKIEQLSFCCSVSVAKWAKKTNSVPQSWETSKKFEKNW